MFNRYGLCRWKSREAADEWLSHFDTRQANELAHRLVETTADIQYFIDKDWVFVGFLQADSFTSHRFLAAEFTQWFDVIEQAVDDRLLRHLTGLKTSEVNAALEQLGGYTNRLYERAEKHGVIAQADELLGEIIDMDAQQRAVTNSRFRSSQNWDIGDIDIRRGDDGVVTIAMGEWQFRHHRHRDGLLLEIRHAGSAIIYTVKHYATARTGQWDVALQVLQSIHERCQTGLAAVRDTHRHKQLRLLLDRLLQENIVDFDDFNNIIAGRDPGTYSTEVDHD